MTASALALGGPSLAEPAGLQSASLPEEGEFLLLELTVNGRPTGTLIELERLANGCERVSASALAEAGLPASGETPVCLDTLEEIEAEIDYAGAALLVFTEQYASGSSRPAAPGSARFARQISGLTATYGLSLQHYDDGEDGTINAFGDLSAQFHTPHGRLENDMLLITGQGGTDVERFRTVYQYDFVESLAQLSIGDSFSRAPGWGRLSSFAGLQIGTDLSMDPDQSWMPFRTLKALLRERSDVDVRVNGVVRDRTSVDPGVNLFDIHPETGLNEVEITIRDGNGLTRIEDYSFFARSEALAAGVQDYSVSIGVPRDTSSAGSNYDNEIFANSYVRQGITDEVTGEAYLEMGSGTVVGGGGAQFAIGKLGTIDLSGALSRSEDDRSGQMLSVRLDRQTRRGIFEVHARLASEDFSDTLTERGVAFPDVSLRASIGQFTDFGSFRASYTEERDTVLNDRRFTAFTWNKAFDGNRLSTFASAYHDIEADDTGVTIGLRATFGSYSARASASRALGDTLIALQASHARRGYDGTQWDIQVTETERFDTVQANLQHATPQSELFASAGSFGDITLVSGGIRGGFVAAGNSFAFVRETGTAAALVQTGDLGGATIYKFNHEVARSGENGQALVANLRAFETNTLTINPEEMPLDRVGSFYRADFVPVRGIVGVEFDVHRDTSLAFTIYGLNGEPLPQGTPVILVGSRQRCPVGYDGRAFCEEASDTDQIRLVWQGETYTAPVRTLRQTGRFDLTHLPEVEVAIR